MAALSTLDVASFERLTGELIRAGFEPVAGSDHRIWEGPVAEPFTALTQALVMRIHFRDGWPFRHPHVYVQGLGAEHVNDAGLVCLWPEDDNSREWLTFGGIVSRIAQWCTSAQEGFRSRDRALDAYLGFEEVSTTLAVFDPTKLLAGDLRDGASGRIHGVHAKSAVLEVGPGHGPKNSVRGRWFSRSEFGSPPRNLEQIRAFLTTAQRRDLDACIRRVRRSTSDGAGLAMILAGRHGQVDALVIGLNRDAGGQLRVESLNPAPNDLQTLRLRAGPDAQELSPKKVVCFGLGAIGSHAALLLAESGLGHVSLVDSDRLRPGNVVRHVLGADHVGELKSEAVSARIGQHAPWTQVSCSFATFDYVAILDLVGGADLVLDTTGNAPLLEVLSRAAQQAGVCLVSAALYRGGAITRICRQLPSDTPIFNRSPPAYWEIPARAADPDESLEMGCSAAVNNAPPVSVQTAASLSVNIAVDAMLARHEFEEETLEVLRPLRGEPPFDRVGLVAPPG